MNSQITGLRVAGIVFGLMSLAQLLRLIIQPTVIVAGHLLPLWPSILAFLILASLCFWLLQLTHHHS
jgi:O-antigen/teichoic acid export membrane protein